MAAQAGAHCRAAPQAGDEEPAACNRKARIGQTGIKTRTDEAGIGKACAGKACTDKASAGQDAGQIKRIHGRKRTELPLFYFIDRMKQKR